MKNSILFSFIFAVLFTACSSDNTDKAKLVVDASTNRGEPTMTENQKKLMAINAHIDTEKKSGKVYKEVFPGYEFGMSNTQIERTNKKMARRGEVEKYRKAKKNTYAYAYMMPISGGEAPALFNFTYNKKGEMFKGEGVIKTPEGSSTYDVLNITADLFTKWFGAAPAFDAPSYNNCARYIWINGNRLVDLRCELEGVTVTFYNLQEETPVLYFEAPQIITPQDDVKEDEKKEEPKNEQTIQTN